MEFRAIRRIVELAGASKPCPLVRIVEDVPASNRHCVHRSDTENIVDAIVVSKVVNAPRVRTLCPSTATSKICQTAKLQKDLVMRRDDVIKIQHSAILQGNHYLAMFRNNLVDRFQDF